MQKRFHVAPAVLPSTGRRIWIVLDRSDGDALVPEVRDFAMFLDGADRSENTIRTYIPKVAMFLNWADQVGCDWRDVTLPEMARFRWSLEAESPSVSGVQAAQRSRKPRTINLILTAVLEFLRYCVRQGVIDQIVVKRLVEQRYVHHLPAGFDPGENGQHRSIRVKEIRARETFPAPKTLTPAQLAAVHAAAKTPRDKFLFILLDATAIRIGEALGLRRSDMHLLPDSTSLGCEISGSHVHVIRRTTNANRALGKTRTPRHIPVLDEVAIAYRNYQIARDDSDAPYDTDHVLVNLNGGAIGAPMTYSGVLRVVQRIGGRAQIQGLHPHIFRHTTATKWIQAGVAPDVVQTLLGHASPESTSVYTHTPAETLRAAVALGSAALTHSLLSQEPQ